MTIARGQKQLTATMAQANSCGAMREGGNSAALAGPCNAAAAAVALADRDDGDGRRTRGGGGAGARDLNREVVAFGASGCVDDVTCDEEALEGSVCTRWVCCGLCTDREGRTARVFKKLFEILTRGSSSSQSTPN